MEADLDKRHCYSVTMGDQGDVRTSRPPASVLRGLMDSEAAGGLILIAAAALALLLANSPFAGAYFEALDVRVGGTTILHGINDALMTLFFLLVGLEIKREMVDGELATWPRRMLPGFAAAGGMIVPALIYVALNYDEPLNLRGWAIPTATDIAFALGVLRLLGPRVPVSLKVFLTALAIIDDLGAVALIALLYTKGLSFGWLAVAALVVTFLWAANRARVVRLAPYLLLGCLLWFATLQSGIHATLSGVALALTIPVTPSPGRPDDRLSPLHRLEHLLQPWVAYLIIPLFGFANAGVSLTTMTLDGAAAGVPVGIAAGLFFGKQLGVFAFSWAAIRLGLADRPKGATYLQLYGVCLLCGIGFTMSLFIGMLAFPDGRELNESVKLGVLLGSLLSAVAGSFILAVATRRSSQRHPR